jgi:undecaprenyl-diphosphatase
VNLWSAIGLGVLQGVAEFLPISSSAHLALLEYFLGLEDTPRFFDVALHVGTLIAVLGCYRQLWAPWLRVLFTGKTPADSSSSAAPAENSFGTLGHKQAYRLVALVVLGTLPAVIAGATFRPTKIRPGEPAPTRSSFRHRVGDLRENASRHPWMVLGFLSVTSVVLLLSSRLGSGPTGPDQMTFRQALGIGVAQALSAIFPGLSRSGMTISTALLLGLRAEWAVHFSLLLSIPAVLGALVLKSADLDPSWLTGDRLTATLMGTLTSLIVGWLSIRLLMGSVRRGKWWVFSIYLACLIAVVAATLLARTAP